MLAKVCPRCGAQYENLKSTTCPQCFAKLLVVDEATAEELSAARAAVEQSPEFQQAKAEDDEKFKEQSFGACFGVALISLVTVIVIAVIIYAAAHRKTNPAALPAKNGPHISADTSDILTPLPVAAASPDDLLPPTVGPFTRAEADTQITLPGTLTHVYHAAYVPTTNAPARSRPTEAQTLDVYVLSTGRPTSEQNAFLAGVALAARRGANAQGVPCLIFATEHWRYAAIGPISGGQAAPVQFRDALAARFR